MKSSSLNMTEGNILKDLIFFAIPVLIGNIFQQLYNVADTAIIGNILGDDAFAAVGAAAPVYGLMIGFAGGLTNGFAVIIARYFGADDRRRMSKAVGLTYILSAAVALILTIASIIIVHPMMLALKTPEKIINSAENYIRIIMLFSVVTIAYNMLAGMMRAVGNSKAPLYFLVISTLINIVLDLIFVKFLKTGVSGAAYATVISQAISAVLCFIYALKNCPFLIFSKKGPIFDKKILFDLITTGLSMGLMYAIVSIGSVILQGAVNSFGTATIAAHTAARKIDDIFMLPLGTVALSASTFASQNYGAGKMDRVRRGIRYSISIACCWSIFSIIVCIFLRRPLIRALTGTADQTIISTASKYIIWNVSFFVILSFLLVLRSSLQGLGRRIVPICGSIVELLLKILTASFFAKKLGYFGVCISEPVIWIFCAAIVCTDYFFFIRKTVKNDEKREINE